MREILFFIIAASIVGTVFFVSLLELIFTMSRRKANEKLQAQIKELRATYNESVNRIVLEDEAKIEAAEKEVAPAAETAANTGTEALEAEYKAKLDAVTAKSEKAVEAAKAKAAKLEREARLKADEYLAERQKEVEEDLMNLVISVTKKVLPEGLTYDIHKELVMQALNDAKIDTQNPA